MTNEEYQLASRRTHAETEGAFRRLSDDRAMHLNHAVIGICTEAGELADQLKRHVFYGRPLDLVNIKEEAGDLLWYISLALTQCGLTISEAMDANIAKLKARYPLKFTEEDASARDLKKELEALGHSQGEPPMPRNWKEHVEATMPAERLARIRDDADEESRQLDLKSLEEDPEEFSQEEVQEILKRVKEAREGSVPLYTLKEVAEHLGIKLKGGSHAAE